MPVVQVRVQAPPRQGGARVAALAGVVVDDVEDDLDARLVEDGHHSAELVDDGLGAAHPGGGGRVGGLGGEERQRRVAPVVGEPALGEEGLVALGVDGQQLDGGHPQVQQVGHARGVGQARVGAAQLGRHAGHVLREALDVDLVQDRAVPRDPGLGGDGEGGGDDDVARHVGRRVQGGPAHRVLVGVEVLVHAVRVHGRPQVDGALDSAPVGVQQELAGVVEHAAVGVPRPVDPQAVAGARPQPGDVPVPHAGRRTEEGELGLVAGLVEDAQVHARGVARDDGHVEAARRGVHAQSRRDRIRLPHANARRGGVEHEQFTHLLEPSICGQPLPLYSCITSFTPAPGGARALRLTGDPPNCSDTPARCHRTPTTEREQSGSGV